VSGVNKKDLGLEEPGGAGVASEVTNATSFAPRCSAWYIAAGSAWRAAVSLARDNSV
jgi:hypothetical protein